MASDDTVVTAQLPSRQAAVDTSPDGAVNAHLIRTALDLLPLVVFFVSNLLFGIFWATGLCMAATLISISAGWLLLHRVSAMALVTGLGVMVFGGLTIYLHNDLFFKIKPTIVNLLFASALLGGLWFNQLFVRSLLGEALTLAEPGWRKLQLRWGLFFILLALVNEVARYNLSTEVWAASKFASVPLTFIFMAFQVGLIKEYGLGVSDQVEKTPDGKPSASEDGQH
jgi:intracellular septation protein